MFRISPFIERLENKVAVGFKAVGRTKMGERIERKVGRFIHRNRERMSIYIAAGITLFYLYTMFVNSIKLGMESTFRPMGAETPVKLLEWNPLKNMAALFSPTGFGVTFFFLVMIILLNKKCYHFFSGYKYERDHRGFDVLPDGTHGTSGFLKREEMTSVLECGGVSKITGTVLGKIKEYKEDPDKYAEYVSLKQNNGLNEHILVFGASGAGKSRGFVKPFILQCAKRKESLVLVDPKGEFFESMSEYLRNQGYVVKAFNLLDMQNSDAWNVMADIETDENLVQQIAEVIIRNTSNASERQDFWEKAELNLFMALLHYVQELKVPGTDQLLPIDQRSLGAIYKMLAGDGFTKIDQLMNELPKGHPAIRPYGIFKLANRQIWGNIAIGLGNRLGVFQNDWVDKITKYNDIDLELPGKQPCAYFCIISDQDSSLEFLSSLFFSTLFARLTNYARRNGMNGRLPVKVNTCLDEFGNIGKILDFKKLISTVRSRGINCQVIVQSAAQLSDRYENKEWEEIISNCDTQIFLGCNDAMTAEFISNKCGKITIQTTNNAQPVTPLFSPVISSTRPYTQTKTNTQRALLFPDEVLRLPNEQCIVLLRGQKPLMLYKIIPDELPDFEQLHYARISDYTPKWREKEEVFRILLNRDTKEHGIPEEKDRELLNSAIQDAAPSVDIEKTAGKNPSPKGSGSMKYSFITEEENDVAENEAPTETIDTAETSHHGEIPLIAEDKPLRTLSDEETPCLIEEMSPSDILD